MKSLADRFWEKVNKAGPIHLRLGTRCWMWTGSGSAHKQRAQFHTEGKTGRINAARMAWLLSRGHIPAGALVCHHCDNKLCVRPDHLYLGTHSTNARDAVERGQARLPNNIGRPCRPETRAKISAALTGRPLSAEHKAKIRLAHLGLVPWNYGLRKGRMTNVAHHRNKGQPDRSGKSS